MSPLQTFADRYRLRIRVDDAGDRMIPGRDGLLYDYGSGRLGVMVLDLTPRRWGNIRRRCEAVGMELLQDGDAEGALLFDPAAAAQAQLAIRVAHVKRRRVVSEATRQRLARLSRHIAAERPNRTQGAPLQRTESPRSTSDVSEAA